MPAYVLFGAIGLRIHRRARCDTGEPGGDFGVGRIERLAHLTAEVDPAVEQDICQCKTAAAQVLFAG